MKALRLLLFAFLIFMVVSLSWQKENLISTVDICRLFKDGVQLRKPGTCDEGVVCENFVSKPGVKCPAWYGLDSVASPCVTEQPSDDYCKAPCATKSIGFVADKKSCSGWYQCNGKTEVNRGICPAGQIFNEKQQMCLYSDPNSCVKTYEFCDVVPKDIPFADEANCHKYYMCSTKAKLTSYTCPTGQYFDRTDGVCNSKAQVDCYKHPYPDKVCGDTKIALRNRFVDDQATCRGYFYCKDQGVGNPDPSPNWGQCSVSEFFNPTLEACQDRNHVKCNEDRCDGRSTGQKEISGRKGCQHYLICGDGFTKEEVYCGDGKYFDADLSECTTTYKSYGACA